MANERTKKRLLQIGTAIAIIGSIIVNILANLLPINNMSTAELSDALPNLFVPAGITFSIWGVIYVLLIVFVVFQSRDIFKKSPVEMPFLHAIGPWAIIASIANGAWIFLWHYQQVAWSLVAILIMFGSLLMIYLGFKKEDREIGRTEYLCVRTPFSVYFGWLSVATIANVTAVLVDLNWDGFGIAAETWTILILIVAFLVCALVLLREKDIPYTLVFIWAFAGIALKRFSDDPVFGVQTTIAWVAVILLVLLAIGVAERILFPLISKKK